MLTLLQRAGAPGGPGAGGAGTGPDETIFVLIIVAVYIGIILFAILIQVMFLLSLYRCFSEISEHNRQMSPGQVWLNLIPLFGTVWLFLTVIRLADSLKDEYDYRDLEHEGDFGKTVGLVYLISALVCPYITLIPWIMYWLKVSAFTHELRETAGRARRRSKRRRDYNDDDDDVENDRLKD
jgi:hypothetical protein